VFDLPAPIPVRGDISLRRWRRPDAAAVADACSDPELARWIPVPRPYTLDHALAYIEQTVAWWTTGEAYAFCIARGDSAIGSITIRPRADPPAIGYWIAGSERRQGIATAAVDALVAWAGTTLALTEVWIEAAPANEASRRVARSAGFEEQPGVTVGPDDSLRVRHRRVLADAPGMSSN
jgi:RimJ/RimL family protein N-acetyltransferase